MRIEYHPQVAQELEEIRDFYEQRSVGLGFVSVDVFERQVSRIAGAPERWMKVQGDVRRCMLSRFPYVIYFRQISPQCIRITVIKHQRRHPEYGRDRA